MTYPQELELRPTKQEEGFINYEIVENSNQTNQLIQQTQQQSVQQYQQPQSAQQIQPAPVNYQQQPIQQPTLISQQPVQKQQRSNKGIDISFRYNEKSNTYKKLRVERYNDNLLLTLVEGEKGKGYETITIQLSLEDLVKLKWIIDNELERIKKELEF
jgi:quinol monooxygenase YgiN